MVPPAARSQQETPSRRRTSSSLLQILAPLMCSLDCATVPLEDRGGSNRPLTATWPVDSVAAIGGYAAKTAGAPAVSGADEGGAAGKQVCFGGHGDAVVLPVNPLAEQSGFSVEILLKPAASGGRTQTALHIEDNLGDARVLIELHSTAKDKDGPGSRRWQPRLLVRNKVDQVKLEPAIDVAPDAWHWLGTTFGEGRLRLYLDGKQVAEAPMSLVPMNRGNMALGGKLNFEGWFKGCVRELRFANGALPANRIATAGAGGPGAPAAAAPR